MSSISTHTAAQKLVQTFSDISSTEDLILFVAGTDNMLPFCQSLIEQHDQDESTPVTLEINSLCAAQGVLPGLLYSEIRKVLIALNRFHHAGVNHYATLGLRETASIDEVKKTYRQLSKQHHPDLAQNNDNDTKHFLEITGAYHAIMASLSDAQIPDHNPWRTKSKHFKRNRRRNRIKFLLIVFLLILTLAGISFYVLKKYNEKIMLNQIEASFQSEAYSADLIKSEVSAVTIPTSPAGPPPKDLFLEETAGDKVLTKDHHPLPKSKQEEPLATSFQEKITSSPPQKLHTNLTTVQDTHSPGITKRYKPVSQYPVKPTLPTSEPEQQKPVQQIAKAKAVEKRKDTQPIQRITPGKKKSHDTQKQLEQNDLKLAIETILTEYSKSYCSKDLEHFLTLFNTNATENGHPHASLIDQYKSLFSHTNAINLDFDNMEWKEFQDGFQATCTFKSNYSYKDGRAMEHAGNITFYLTDEQDGLKIQSLDYVFLN